MKNKQIKTLSESERKEKLREIRLELIKELAQVASGTAPKNPGLIREHKRTIARIKALSKEESA